MNAMLNPPQALDALVGREYGFKGRKIRNTNRALIAVESAGIPLVEFNRNLARGAIVAVYAMMHSAEEVDSALAKKNGINAAALAYAETLTPEELGEAAAIFADCANRFFASIATYKAEGTPEGNDRAAAASS